ncbi:MAG: glycoside hydrolase family 3 C-terminal domain-containing protein [Polyangiaceae bacterium]
MTPHSITGSSTKRALRSVLGTVSFVALSVACATPTEPRGRSPLAGASAGSAAVPASAAVAPNAWRERSLSPDERAERLVRAMTQAEKLTVVTGYFGGNKDWNEYRSPESRPQSAGVVLGVPRLGFTVQWQTDAGSGVATQGEAAPELERTLLPSGILTASTWNPALAERGGVMIGSEARATGFNVMLAGGVNLMREPGNGRNFEYAGEDPLLAGTMVGAIIRGIQSNHIVSTVKHFAFNDQETGRSYVNAVIDEAAARISDLLAFQIAIEQGDPGSVMCSYNLVNGAPACESAWLLNQVLKGDWGFKGYVMSDWGAQHDTVRNANQGLDQETGVSKRGAYVWLDKLSAAIAKGDVSEARLDEMVRRIARTLIAKGAIDEPVQPGPIDFAAHARVTQADAEEGIVLLKNQGVLPLGQSAKRIVVIGGHADAGVLTGGGSAQVYARGGNAVRGLGPKSWPGPEVYAGSSPLAALRKELPGASITWLDGADSSAAAAAAKKADVAIVFATQWTAESLDFSLTLPGDQDRLIDAVAGVNAHTVVVLETGGPVLMPWLARVAGVLEAWYPGSEGGPAIARVLSGAVNPSGALPVSFPRSLDQLPRPKSAGQGLPDGQRFDVHYDEGAAVGYRWYDKLGKEPLFPFGHGLSYTTFVQDGLVAAQDTGELRVSFRIRNTGAKPGKHVAQVYVSPVAGGWEAPQRLAGFLKVELEAGASQTASVQIDPRLLAVYEPTRHGFRVAAGVYRLTLGSSSRVHGPSVTIALPERSLASAAR